MKLLSLGLAVVCCVNFAYGATGAIRGRALDAATREPLAGVTISLVDAAFGGASDADGVFKIEGIPAGTYHVRGFAFGYEGIVKPEVQVLPKRTTEIELLFGEKVFEGEEVTVTTGFFTEVKHDMPTSVRSLSYEEVRRAPGGVGDVQRIIQALPGVTSENDQNNEIVVRGGSPIENLTIMDGLEIDNISHYGEQQTSGGPISLLNPEFLRDVSFASGGFSAKYGDRASSVLDLELRDGSRDRHEAELEMSMAGAGALAEGPIADGKGAYIFSARKSYLDLIPQGATGLTAIPNYWDAHGKLTYDFSARHKLSLNALYGNDRVEFDSDEPSAFSRGVEYVNYLGDRYILGGRLRSLWGSGYTDLVIGTTRSTYDAIVKDVDYDSQGNRTQTPVFFNKSTEITTQTNLSYTGRGFGARDEWTVGGILKPITFAHDIFFAEDTTWFEDGYLAQPDGQPDELITPETHVQESTTSPKYGAFAQYTYHPNRVWTLTPGVRYDGFAYSGSHVVGPRLSSSYEARKNITLTGAYGWYYQSHPFTVYTSDPDGANQKLDHYRAIQYVLSAKWLPRESSLISLEGYYKDYDKLLVAEQDVVRETTGDYRFRSERMLSDRTKWAAGFEVFMQQKLARNWYGTLSYSFGESRTDDPAYGTTPASYDVRHVVTLVGGYKTNFSHHEGYRNFQRKWYGWFTRVLPINGDELTIASRLRYMSGRPFTKHVWYPVGGGAPDPIFTGHWYEAGYNTDRYPDYTRWDVRLDNKHYFGSTSLVFYLEVQNVLDRPNVAEYFYGEYGDRDTAYQFRLFFVGGVKVEL